MKPARARDVLGRIGRRLKFLGAEQPVVAAGEHAFPALVEEEPAQAAERVDAGIAEKEALIVVLGDRRGEVAADQCIGAAGNADIRRSPTKEEMPIHRQADEKQSEQAEGRHRLARRDRDGVDERHWTASELEVEER